MANASELSVGSFVRIEKELCTVLEYHHRTPGKGNTHYQAKLRNIKTGRLAEVRFRPDEKVDLVRVEQRELQFLYKEADSLVCMDNESFEQFYVPELFLTECLPFLKEGVIVMVAFDGETPVAAEPPKTVELMITYTEPGVKGDTATRAMKKATLETGAIINVPLFVESGILIKVDAAKGEYLERVNKK